MAMSLTRGLCGRSFSQQLSMLRSPLVNHGIPQSVVRSMAGIRVVPASDDSHLSYEEKNSQLKRELSPHLMIYKIQLTSMLSITHRFTGMALSGYAGALGIGALVLPYDFDSVITMIQGLQLSAPTLALIKFYIAFPATYHTINGVRHLCWDMGKFLKLKEVYSTGWLMLGLSLASAAVLAVM